MARGGGVSTLLTNERVGSHSAASATHPVKGRVVVPRHFRSVPAFTSGCPLAEPLGSGPLLFRLQGSCPSLPGEACLVSSACLSPFSVPDSTYIGEVREKVKYNT